MNTIRLATIVTACMLSAPAWANPDLAQKKNCMACHAIGQKVIGPAYKDVATKYAGQPDAVGIFADDVMGYGKRKPSLANSTRSGQGHQAGAA